MRVHELQTILGHVPDDLVVILRGGRGATHVGRVERAAARRGMFPGFHTPDRPAHLCLDSGFPSRPWFEDEPRFTLHGQFRRSDDLLLALGDLP